MSTIGAIGLGFSVLLFVINIFTSLRYGEIAADDPWDGATLEWSIPSPPPVYNFARIPTVHSRDAWWAMKHPERMHLDPIEVTPLAGGPAHATEQAHDVVRTATPTRRRRSSTCRRRRTGRCCGARPVPHGQRPAASRTRSARSSCPIFLIAGLLLLIGSIYGWSFESAPDERPTHTMAHAVPVVVDAGPPSRPTTAAAAAARPRPPAHQHRPRQPQDS